MPTLISETDVKLERADLLRRVPLPRTVGSDGYIVPPARMPGLHLSGLLRYVAKKSRITAYLEQIAEEDLPLRWAMGQAWEEFAASLYPDMLYQPGEALEPVIMTCDGLRISTGRGELYCIEEFKFNRSKKYKGADLLKKKWLWMQQGMGYCLGYGPEIVRWHVLSAFEFPDPIYTQYLVGFSVVELAESRRMIESNRDAAIRAGYAEGVAA
jgi:hypothetical protein